METSSYENYLAQLGIGGAHPGGFALTKQFLEHEKLQRHTELLDAGCGTGPGGACAEPPILKSKVYAPDP